jgi:phosphopantothenoylcysteine synthetase/decarboxylase
MNEQMWFNTAVQRNVELARAHGYHVLEPVEGIEVADLQPTFGVMPPLDQIIGYLAGVARRKD